MPHPATSPHSLSQGRKEGAAGRHDRLSLNPWSGVTASSNEPKRRSNTFCCPSSQAGLNAGVIEEVEVNDQMTTVIIRNVPQNYTRAMLLELLDREGFSGLYDFVYLPVKFGSSSAFGYALVNLIDHEDAQRFQAHFQSFSSWGVECTNVANVSWSKAHQGLTEHVERYRNSPMMHESMPDECKPIILEKGLRVPFPAPTKKASPQRRTERVRHSKKSDSRLGSTTESLCSERSVKSSESACRILGSSADVRSSTMPTDSPLFQGLEWLGGGQARDKVQPGGLFELTTQMIIGSDCGSDKGSSTHMTSSCRSQVSSNCSSARRHGDSWTSTILAAGLEAVVDGRPGYDRKDRQGPLQALHPLLPGSLIEIVGAYPSGEQARVLVVDHAKARYKVQLCNGNVRVIRAKNARLIR